MISKTISLPIHRFYFLINIGLFALIAAAFAAIYVHFEEPVYSWDYVGYWNFYRDFGDEFRYSINKCFQHIYNTITTEDYNASAIVPLLPVYWVFGGSRLVYVCAIMVFYLAPALSLIIYLVRVTQNPPKSLSFLLLASVFFFPLFWSAALRGMIDVAGLIPLAIALILVRKTDFLTNATWKSAALFGLLLWSMFLIRRWYVFSVVALATMSFVWGAFYLWGRRKESRCNMKRFFAIYVCAGLFCLMPMLFFQEPLINRIFHTDYTSMYAGYQVGFYDQFFCYTTFGPFVLFLAVIGISYNIIKCRFENLFELSIGTLTILIFAHIQQPALQHFLPVALFLFPSYWSGLAFISQASTPFIKYILLCFVCLNFVTTFIPNSWGSFDSLKFLFSRVHTYPLHFKNFSEYQRLDSDLEVLDPREKISIFASSDILSDSLLAAIDRNLHSRIQFVAQVDARDGFYWQALDADYFLIGTPIPIHLPPEYQRVITIPSQDILSGSGFGASLKDTGKIYNLERGMTAHLYKRVHPLSPQDITQLAEQFYKYYPEWRDRDRTNVRLLLSLASLKLGDESGRVDPGQDNTLIIYPGNTSPTTLTYETNEMFNANHAVAFIAKDKSHHCKDADGVDLIVSGEGKKIFYTVLPGSAVNFDLPKTMSISLSVFPRQNSHCDRLILSFQ